MKELIIEQKAKAYDEAIEKIKYVMEHGVSPVLNKEDLQGIFPELKESEEERIIKAIKSAVLQLTDIYLQEKYGLKQSDCIAWLEKQANHADFCNKIQIGDKVTRNEDGVLVNLSQLERVAKPSRTKPTDKIKAKFDEDDWVVSPNGVYWHIDKISNNRYEVTSNTGENSNWPLDTNIYHRFTIQDAKAGDVLSYGDGQWIFIYKERKNEPLIKYYALASEKGLAINDAAFTVLSSCIVPATKEQRDTLERAMKEAGYEWSDKDRKLIKIVK